MPSVLNSPKSPVVEAKNNFQQTLGLAGISLGSMMLSEAATNKMSSCASRPISLQEIIVTGVTGGILASSIYSLVTFIPPMWKEVTKFKPDQAPFYTANAKMIK